MTALAIAADRPGFELRRDAAPVAEIAPGTTIALDTQDAFSGQIRNESDRRDRGTVPHSNPAVGPIAVAGAAPGDSLAVTIESIEPLDGSCATYAAPLPAIVARLGDRVDGQARICRIDGNAIRWSERLTIPFAPMIGMIGVAPAMGAPTTGQVGDHGGNLDIRAVAPGAVVHLPVLVDGALLYVGDCHAAQGDGEPSRVALEMAASLRLTVALDAGRPLPGPRVVTDTDIVAIASGPDLDATVTEAYARLILWLEQDYGWDRVEAYTLVAQVGRLTFGFPGGGAVGASIRREFAEPNKGRPDGADD